MNQSSVIDEKPACAHKAKPVPAFTQPQHPRLQRYSVAGQRGGISPPPAYCPRHGSSGVVSYDREGNVIPPPIAFTLGRKWNTGLFHCLHDTNVCVEVTFCPYCQAGYQYHRTKKSFVGMNATVCVGMCCLDMVLAGGGYLVVSTVLRQRIVDRYQLNESTGMVLCRGLFCSPCTLCQLHREMTLRSECPGGVCIEGPRTIPPAMRSMDASMENICTCGTSSHPTPLFTGAAVGTVPNMAGVYHMPPPLAQNPYYAGALASSSYPQAPLQQASIVRTQYYPGEYAHGYAGGSMYPTTTECYSPTAILVPRPAAAADEEPKFSPHAYDAPPQYAKDPRTPSSVAYPATPASGGVETPLSSTVPASQQQAPARQSAFEHRV
jgi:Cys-rich protein (TIGR01571 family)